MEKKESTLPTEALAPVEQAPPTDLTVLARDAGDIDLFIAEGTAMSRIEIMRESPFFRLPTGQLTDTFRAHVIYLHEAKQYWPDVFGQGEQRPRCASTNGRRPDAGIHPFTYPSCHDCPHNEFGSGKEGRGKACQDSILLYLRTDYDSRPVILKAPPSSLGGKADLKQFTPRAYSALARTPWGRALPHESGLLRAYQLAAVNFGLETRRFDSGTTASVLTMQIADVLDPREKENADFLKWMISDMKIIKASLQRTVGEVVQNEADSADEEIPI